MTHTATAHHSHRLELLDVARGVLISLMIIAHGIVFFNRNNTPYLWAMDQVIDIIAFIGLLFISGAAMSYAYLQRDYSKNDWRLKQRHIAKKMLLMLFGYYLIGIFVKLPLFLTADSETIINHLARVFLFIDVPEFAEFLLPFMAYYLLTLTMRRFLKRIISNTAVLWAVIFFLFVSGNVLSYFPLPIGDFQAYQQILAGAEGVYRFPLLQYLPIFLLGAYWASKKDWNSQHFVPKEIYWFLAGLIGTALALGITLLLGDGNSPLLVRWPPNLAFISSSLTLNLLLLMFLEFVIRIYPQRYTGLFDQVGKRAFLYYFYHILLLYAFQFSVASNWAFDALGTLAATTVLLLLCALLVKLFHSMQWIMRILRGIENFGLPLFYTGLLLTSGYYAYNYVTTLPAVTAGDYEGEPAVSATPAVIKQGDFTFTQSISRNWLLKDHTQPGNYSRATYSVDLGIPTVNYKYVTILLDNKAVATYKRSDSHRYSHTLNALELEPGEHIVQLQVEDKDIKSLAQPFKVSYPLYVTWTLDHEGYDISDTNLTAIDRIADKYTMPLTILTTPRIYVVPDISKERARVVTEWMLRHYRENKAEIGMHLHMHLDMLKAANLPFPLKTEPRWGGRTNGHDVVNYAYNYSEYDQIIKWALRMFEQNGLPRPITYRAGGWFMGLDNLKVVEANGFLIDSSGRDSFTWGNNNLLNPWDLQYTTKPYIPAWDDQNAPGTPDNSFTTLWEFPNNGADSTNNAYKVLEERFRLNFDGKPLTEAQTLTYLSHPHWFITYDEATMDKILHTIEPYKIEKDGGPVIFSTLERAYQFWK